MLSKFLPDKNITLFKELYGQTANIFLKNDKIIAIFNNGKTINFPISFLHYFKSISTEELNKITHVISIEEKSVVENIPIEVQLSKKYKKERKKEKEEDVENELNENFGSNDLR